MMATKTAFEMVMKMVFETAMKMESQLDHLMVVMKEHWMERLMAKLMAN